MLVNLAKNIRDKQLMKKTLLFLLLCFPLFAAKDPNDKNKKSWARVMRDMAYPFCDDYARSNWDRLVRDVEGENKSNNDDSYINSNNSSTNSHDNNDIPPLSSKACTFKDIAGGVPQEITDLLQFIKGDDSFKQFGITPPRGILLVGPPGTGKTLLARALAGEAGCPFLYKSATDFIEIYVGTGPARIRELFNNAKQLAASTGKKVIIFIDEIDAIGSRENLASHDSESKRTLNQLLVEMDGFGTSDEITVLAATNNSKALDSALKRPGRFDKIVAIPLPDKEKREAILRHYIAQKPKNKIASDINYELLAQCTEGFSAAEIAALVNNAATHAHHEHAKKISQSYYERALTEIRNSKKH